MEPVPVNPPFTALLSALQAGTQAGAVARPAGAPPAAHPQGPSSSPAPVAASAVAFRGSLVRQVRALIEAAGADQITGSGIAPPGTADPPPGTPAAGPGNNRNLLADGGLNPDQAAMDATGTSNEGARPLAALSAFRNLSAATGQLLSRAENALRVPDPVTTARAAALGVAPASAFAAAAVALPAAAAAASDANGPRPAAIVISEQAAPVPPSRSAAPAPVTRADVAPVAPSAPPDAGRPVQAAAPAGAAGPVEVSVAPPAPVVTTVAAGVVAGPQAPLVWSTLESLRVPAESDRSAQDDGVAPLPVPVAGAGAAPAAPLVTPPTPGAAQAALTRIAEEAARSAPGTIREVDLNLATPELGRLRVRLVMAERGGVRVEVRAATEQAATALRNDLPHLAATLAGHGLALDGAQVAVSSAAFGGSNDPGQPRQQPRWFEHGGRGGAPEGVDAAAGSGSYARRLTAVDLMA